MGIHFVLQGESFQPRDWTHGSCHVSCIADRFFFFKPLSHWGNSYINIASLFTISNILLILLSCIYKAWFKQTLHTGDQCKLRKWRDFPHISLWPPDPQGKLSAWQSTQIPCWHLKFNMSGPPLTSWALLCRPCFTPTPPPVSWVTQSQSTASLTSDDLQWLLPPSPPLPLPLTTGIFPPLVFIPSV